MRASMVGPRRVLFWQVYKHGYTQPYNGVFSFTESEHPGRGGVSVEKRRTTIRNAMRELVLFHYCRCYHLSSIGLSALCKQRAASWIGRCCALYHVY